MSTIKLDHEGIACKVVAIHGIITVLDNGSFTFNVFNI